MGFRPVPSPFIQNPGQTFNNPSGFNINVASGILSPTAVFGTANAANANANITNIVGFNAQNSGFNSGSLFKGSLVELSANGHAPDILVSVVSSSQITVLTAPTGTVAENIGIFNYPAAISGEAGATTNTNTLLSSYFIGNSGVGGVVDQTDLSNAISGSAVFIAGGAFTPTAGGYLALWFLASEDGGLTFEKTVSNTALPRAPDAIIPFFASAYAAGARAWAKNITWPAEPFKVLFQDVSGATMPSTWAIFLIPEGDEY